MGDHGVAPGLEQGNDFLKSFVGPLAAPCLAGIAGDPFAGVACHAGCAGHHNPAHGLMIGTGGQHGREYLHSVLCFVEINDKGVHHVLLGLYL